MFSSEAHMRRLLPILALSLVGGHLMAQTPSADDIIERAIARRAANVRSDIPLTAMLHTSSTIEVSRGRSLVAVIPDQTVTLESSGVYARDRELGTRIRIHERRGTELAAGPARSLIEN